MEDDKVKAIKELTDGLFRKLIALIMILFGGAFLWDMALKTPEMANIIVGFVIGTVFSTVLGFYFYTTESSKEKSKQIHDIMTNGGAE